MFFKFKRKTDANVLEGTLAILTAQHSYHSQEIAYFERLISSAQARLDDHRASLSAVNEAINHIREIEHKRIDINGDELARTLIGAIDDVQQEQQNSATGSRERGTKRRTQKGNGDCGPDAATGISDCNSA